MTARAAAKAESAMAEPLSFWMADAPLLRGLIPALAAPTGIAGPPDGVVSAFAGASGSLRAPPGTTKLENKGQRLPQVRKEQPTYVVGELAGAELLLEGCVAFEAVDTNDSRHDLSSLPPTVI